ncbi:MAG: hypothetical protein H8E36_04685 [Rhodospirillaceae bacterium]|nr:hypothetical protein [Rhodospirillaceae bacterium]
MLDFLKKRECRKNMKRLIEDAGAKLDLVAELALTLREFRDMSQSAQDKIYNKFNEITADMMQKSGQEAEALYWQNFQYGWKAEDLRESSKAADIQMVCAIDLARVYVKALIVIASNDSFLDFSPASNIAEALDDWGTGLSLEDITRRGFVKNPIGGLEVLLSILDE